MNKLQKRVIGFIATGALLVNSALPVFASTVVIEGNGPDTENTVNVEQSNTVGVQQDNYASVHNMIVTSANTGGNTVDKATGGDVNVKTGDASTEASVANTLNSNAANVECCDQGDYDLKIAGNGPDSKNIIELGGEKEEENGVYVTQNNQAYVENEITTGAFTGGNDVNKPTGGDVSVDTGDASVKVSAVTAGNANSAYVGGNGTGTLSAWIVGNGPDTDNLIDLDLEHEVIAEQTNYASIHNMVKAGAGTGENTVDKSTGGEVEIKTGDADVEVELENAVNFNWADLDCGCLLGSYTYKIAGNGPNSDNELDIDLDGGAWAIQGNVAGSGISNGVMAEALTGENEVDKSTGSYDGDPSIDTGDAYIYAGASNTGNVNVVGGMPGFEWPEMPDFGDYGFQFGFNWAFFMAWANMNG